jgi:hypothetical protein
MAKAAPGVPLYHFTVAAKVLPIMEQGLLPARERSSRRRNRGRVGWSVHRSRTDGVRHHAIG